MYQGRNYGKQTKIQSPFSRMATSISHEVWKICFHIFFTMAAVFLI